MSRRERELVIAIRDGADKYLAATNHAEKYIYSRQFVDALIAYNDHALAGVRAEGSSR